MRRKRNDATLSKLGDIYQYYIALLDCFKMKAGEKIQIELQGDVTLISGDKGSFQKEVKHHTSASKLSDRDIDFWNTLRNWIIDYSDSMKFDQLILFTTADISAKSVFYNWNMKEKAEKYDVLYNIGKIVKQSEKNFRPCYNDVFNSVSITRDQVSDLLDKFQIEHLQPQIQGISARFSNHLITIPEVNRDNYIASLLGTVLQQVVKPPHIWEVPFEIFQEHVQNLAPAYMKAELVPLPMDFLSYEPARVENEIAKEKNFVKALENIEYKTIVPYAISDYWKAAKTIARYFSDNISYTSSLTAYSQSLAQQMFYAKQSIINGESFPERSQELIASRRLCSNVLGWPPSDFGSIVANQLFFKNGVVHNIVDNKAFAWDVGDDDYES